MMMRRSEPNQTMRGHIATACAAFFATLLFASTVFATGDGTSGFYIRGGVGSLYGPAFNTGQPRYAQDDIIKPENERPFGTMRQMISTFGLSGSYQLYVSDGWAVGLTGLVGFNATGAKADDFGSDLQTDHSLQGLTYGGGLRASYGNEMARMTFDVIGSQTDLTGNVHWEYRDFFSDDVQKGDARYAYSLNRVALLVGYELDADRVFWFMNAGAQFLPAQDQHYESSGTFPDAHEGSSLNHTVVPRPADTNGTVHFDPELSFAASTGVGVRL